MSAREPDTCYTHMCCECSTPEHTIRVYFDEDENLPDPTWLEFVVETQLTQQGFFRRLKAAYKYVFGGDHAGWDSTLLSYANVLHLHLMTKRYLRLWERLNDKAGWREAV